VLVIISQVQIQNNEKWKKQMPAAQKNNFIIELLINTLMLSVVCPFVICLLVIVVSNSTPTS
jgi:hypothetical protein